VPRKERNRGRSAIPGSKRGAKPAARSKKK
jgi:hypothetical protein